MELIKRETQYYRSVIAIDKSADQNAAKNLILSALENAIDNGYGTVTIRIQDHSIIEISRETSTVH
jgi:hypothetical protein